MMAIRVLKACSLGILLLIHLTSRAQNSEVGFGLGAFNYTGDISPQFSVSNLRPAATVFYRSNMSKVISFRAAVTGGKIAGADKGNFDSFSGARDASFDIFAFEGSTVFEYHFLNWREQKSMIRFTPYLFGGLGLLSMSGQENKTQEYSNVQLVIPFGAGIKYILNPKWYLALEFGARKTFFDYLDNISDSNRRIKNYQYGNPFDNDNYYFIGLSLTRTFYTIPCPTNPYR